MNFSAMMLFVFLPLVFSACKPPQDNVLDIPPQNVNVALADVSSGNCLNLEKLSRIFQSDQFSVPASLMTVAFKPLEEISPAKLNYFSYATFNYKESKANELGLFNEIRQKDCKTVQMLSASEEVMTFEVIASSDKEISIRLLEKFRDTMNSTQKKSLFERQQPYQFSYRYVSPTHLVISEKYRTVDPLCTTKNKISFEVRKDLNWAGRVGDLPQSYEIDAHYLSSVRESLTPNVDNGIVSALEASENVSLEVIRQVMRTPLRDELKLCSQ